MVVRKNFLFGILNVLNTRVNEMGCQNIDCQHNVFYKGLGFKNCGETEISNSFNNCMLQINQNLTLEQIGEMFGISTTRVRAIEEKALRLLRRKTGLYHHFIEQLEEVEEVEDEFPPKLI